VLFPAGFTCFDVLVAQGAPVGGFQGLGLVAGLALGVLVVLPDMDTFLAPCALLEVFGFVAFLDQVVVVGGDLDDLAAVLALSEHEAVLPVVQVELLLHPKGLVRFRAELALDLLHLAGPPLLLLGAGLRPFRVDVGLDALLLR